jgi:transposase
MKRFIEGADRTQVSFLPACVEDYVEPENPVRVIEAFVEQLDLRAMGFDGVDPEETGRPADHPAVLLKICIAQGQRYLRQLVRAKTGRDASR